MKSRRDSSSYRSAAAHACASSHFRRGIPKIRQIVSLEPPLWLRDCLCSPRTARSDDRGRCTRFGEKALRSYAETLAVRRRRRGDRGSRTSTAAFSKRNHTSNGTARSRGKDCFSGYGFLLPLKVQLRAAVTLWIRNTPSKAAKV